LTARLASARQHDEVNSLVAGVLGDERRGRRYLEVLGSDVNVKVRELSLKTVVL
jgi:hypothetical protein